MQVIHQGEDRKETEYPLEIEGRVIPWHSGQITTEEIARLGGWDPAQGVMVVDRDNNEVTLAPDQVVQLRPGLGFGKRIRWKRG